MQGVPRGRRDPREEAARPPRKGVDANSAPALQAVALQQSGDAQQRRHLCQNEAALGRRPMVSIACLSLEPDVRVDTRPH